MSVPEVAGLQAALRAEHSAIWGYGVVGAAVSPETRQSVRDVDAAHRVGRDELADLIRALGADPEPAEASYELPFPVVDAAAGLRLAAHLEAGVAEGYAYAIAQSETQPAKEFSLAALINAALRQTSWQQLAGALPLTPEFPGL